MVLIFRKKSQSTKIQYTIEKIKLPQVKDIQISSVYLKVNFEARLQWVFVSLGILTWFKEISTIRMCLVILLKNRFKKGHTGTDPQDCRLWESNPCRGESPWPEKMIYYKQIALSLKMKKMKKRVISRSASLEELPPKITNKLLYLAIKYRWIASR